MDENRSGQDLLRLEVQVLLLVVAIYGSAGQAPGAVDLLHRGPFGAAGPGLGRANSAGSMTYDLHDLLTHSLLPFCPKR
ncbi:hypothetical protein MPTK1_6g14780 [Marchantia polymorpha subsp. ruderalis]|uniref:Uncharacterized protein n=2 Tax=Marchantia polymorpha TaxID=3197 RepID=A0AAF6BS40_MARPO|nr:hypothetical protein MARPO_0047s0133 [Marchantia polymorpha]BBN14824.1 hypothetical protein Mp_6g14780 [Marchantia polymorpha subsp. ruderalis]|eukprot:PTQ39168.1 hypothetical protein MARPO_0047s0133 [Marchantia polymorpha]